MHPASPPEAMRSDPRQIEPRLLQCHPSRPHEFVHGDGLCEIHVLGCVDCELPPRERGAVSGGTQEIEPVGQLSDVSGPGLHCRCPPVKVSRVVLLQGSAGALAKQAGAVLWEGRQAV